jgi:hypothetical protein
MERYLSSPQISDWEQISKTVCHGLKFFRLSNEVQTHCVWDEELGAYNAWLLEGFNEERERAAEALPTPHTLMFRSFYQALPFVTQYSVFETVH